MATTSSGHLYLSRHLPHPLRQLRAVRRAVLEHAAREEREEFAALRRAVGAKRLRMLGAEVKLAQMYAPTRPRAPTGG